MKLVFGAVALVASVGAAQASDDSGSFGGVSGAFGGNVTSLAKSGGVSVSGSWGGYQNSSMRNVSGSGEFAGARVEWSSKARKKGGEVSLSAESFTDGFDFSRTRAGGGYGGGFAARAGFAKADGGFSGGFASGYGSGDWDDGGFPGLGLGHGDGMPGMSDKWDDYDDD